MSPSKCHVFFLSGTFSFQDLMTLGGADEKQQVKDMQLKLQSDDPINIQYTSVSQQPSHLERLGCSLTLSGFFVMR